MEKLEAQIQKKRRELEKLKKKEPSRILALEVTNETQEAFIALAKRFKRVCPGSRLVLNEIVMNAGMRHILETVIADLEALAKKRTGVIE